MATLPTQFSLRQTADQPVPTQGGLVVSSPGQLRLKDTLLMAAAYKAGDDIHNDSSPLPQPSPLLTGNNLNNHNSTSNTNISRSTVRASSSAGGSHGSGNPLDRSNSAADYNEDDQNLRTTCDGCTISKIKCDGGHPCKRCQRRRQQCVYSEKKRCGPKRRRSTRDDDSEDSDPSGAHDADGPHGHGGSSSHKVLTSREQQYLAKYYNCVNKFIPMTCLTVIRDAMNPLPLAVIDGLAASEAERNKYHARKSVLLGCVAVGAVFCGEHIAAVAYMAQAQIHLKDCFDALLPEVVSCYLVMVVYHLHFLDRSKVYRYIGFAQQAYRELVPSQAGVADYVRDSVRVLSTFLHVACNSDIRVEEIDLLLESTPEPGNNSLSRIIAVFSYVLLMIFRRSNPEAAAKASPHKPPPPVAALANMTDEADVLMSMIEDPGSFAVIVMKTLRGYFLLLKGKEQDVVELVALPVAKALEADQGVLHFPLCWHLCQCVSAFLRRKEINAVASTMDRLMDPLRDSLAYASSCCGVAYTVFNVYAGKGSVAPRHGLFSTSRLPKPVAEQQYFHDRSTSNDSASDVRTGSTAAAVAAVGSAAKSGGPTADQTTHQMRCGQQQQRNSGERPGKRAATGSNSSGGGRNDGVSVCGHTGHGGGGGGRGGTGSPNVHDDMPLDSSVFGSSKFAGSSMPIPTESSPGASGGGGGNPLPPMSLDDTGALPRHHGLFGDGGGGGGGGGGVGSGSGGRINGGHSHRHPYSDMEVGGRGRQNLFNHGIFNIGHPPRMGGGGGGGGGHGGGAHGSSGGGGGSGRSGGMHPMDSAGSSPFDAGLSPEASPSRAGPGDAPVDGSLSDSADSALISGILDGM